MGAACATAGASPAALGAARQRAQRGPSRQQQQWEPRSTHKRATVASGLEGRALGLRLLLRDLKVLCALDRKQAHRLALRAGQTKGDLLRRLCLRARGAAASADRTRGERLSTAEHPRPHARARATWRWSAVRAPSCGRRAWSAHRSQPASCRIGACPARTDWPCPSSAALPCAPGACSTLAPCRRCAWSSAR